MSEHQPSRFMLASTAVCLVACAGVAVLPLLLGTSNAFAGSISSSGLLGVVFAARSLQLLRATGTPSLPPAVLTTIFGGWFMLAPLLYSDVGFLPTAGTQLGGTVIATFGLYVTVAGVTRE
ncbi:hypothetical protein [Halorubrum coriense]|nr:hypothetical protein [Halorubrum coriense]